MGKSVGFALDPLPFSNGKEIRAFIKGLAFVRLAVNKKISVRSAHWTLNSDSRWRSETADAGETGNTCLIKTLRTQIAWKLNLLHLLDLLPWDIRAQISNWSTFPKRKAISNSKLKRKSFLQMSKTLKNNFKLKKMTIRKRKSKSRRRVNKRRK